MYTELGGDAAAHLPISSVMIINMRNPAIVDMS